MSLCKSRDAMLEGYSKPLFFSIVDRLNGLAAKQEDFTIYDLDEIGQAIPGFVGSKRMRTSDGYNWFMGLFFEYQGESVAIAIPWFKDVNKKSKSRSDRSIALYGDVRMGGSSTLDLIATRFANAFKNHFLVAKPS